MNWHEENNSLKRLFVFDFSCFTQQLATLVFTPVCPKDAVSALQEGKAEAVQLEKLRADVWRHSLAEETAVLSNTVLVCGNSFFQE